jgi:hypothetical protein
LPESLSDVGSAEREGEAYVMLVCFILNTRRKLGLRAQTLGT